LTKKNEWPVIALAFTLLLSIFIITSLGFTAKIIYLVAEGQKLVLEKNLSQKEKDLLIQEIEGLNARISSADDPWLPDTLYFAGQRIPLENWLVRKRIKDLLSSLLAPGMNAEITRAFRECKRLLPFIDEELAKQNLPYDFRWLYIQESKCDNTAVSRSNAKGIPQFMRKTARDYGLKVEFRYIDERLLPEKAIPASAQYLRDLLDAFPHDPCLALAAYNDGEGDLKRELRENGDTAATYWDIDFQYDPRGETEKFCPAIIRWKLIYENPEKYGLEVPEGDSDEYPEVVLVDTTLTEYTKVGDIARFYGLNNHEFSTLNQYILNAELRSGEYTFRIPKYIFQ